MLYGEVLLRVETVICCMEMCSAETVRCCMEKYRAETVICCMGKYRAEIVRCCMEKYRTEIVRCCMCGSIGLRRWLTECNQLLSTRPAPLPPA